MRRQNTIIACGLFVLAMLHGPESVADTWTGFGGPTADFQHSEKLPLGERAPTKRWQQTLGHGMSEVVSDGKRLYTSFLAPLSPAEKERSESDRTHREVVVALDAETGTEVWRHEYLSGWLESQEAFGGRSRAPQATPVLLGDRLVTIGFTGIMHCLDCESGKVIWTIDAVDRLGAVPVQFGFAASPLVIGDRIIALVGGEGGLLCLDASNGQTIWSVACGEASYATPVHWRRPDGDQLVFVTRNRVVGVDADSGSQLWEYRLPGKGLTNVPTPLVVSDAGLVVSGQGVKGTRRLEVKKNATGNFDVSEAWSSDAQFFYCNWALRDGVIWGCNGNLLIALDVQTGRRLGRFRGYNDANLILYRDGMLVLDGRGHMSRLRSVEDAMSVVDKFALLDQRCWTPPTPVGNYLICRGGDQLLCVDMVGGDPRAAVVAARVRNRELSIATSNTEPQPDAIDRIVASFQSGGSDGAWKTYNSIRDTDPDALPYDDRMQLAELAKSEGLADFEKLIKSHAAEDFPKEAAADREPSTETTRGKNGLVYVEFALQSGDGGTIQATVKGPAAHPFGYGLPIRSNRKRIERWPVGTRLFRDGNNRTADVLLTVTEELAGRTITLPAGTKPSR